MIEKYFNKIISKLENIEKLKTSSHFPNEILESIEDELHLSKGYLKKKPKNYPCDFGEKMGLRKIINSVNATYFNMKLRIGRNTLHVIDKKTKENINSIMLTYMGDAEEESIMQAKAYSSTEVSLVSMLDNGVISTCYVCRSEKFQGPAFNILSWFPFGLEDYGGFLQTNDKTKVTDILENQIKNILKTTTDTQSFKAIPDVYLLCKQVYDECL